MPCHLKHTHSRVPALLPANSFLGCPGDTAGLSTPQSPRFPFHPPHWSPQGPAISPHSEPAFGPGRALQHQQRGGTPVDPIHLGHCDPSPWCPWISSLLSLCPALASFQGPTSPRRTASRPLGMLEPQKLGGVLSGVGEDTSCLIHQPPPRLPLLSAVRGARVSPRVCF